MRQLWSLLIAFAFSPHPAAATTFSFTTGLYTPGVTAPEPLSAPDVLNIDSGGDKFFSAVTFTNQGLVHWNADSLFLQNGASLQNAGTWDATSDNALVDNGGLPSTFDNSGTFRKSAGLGSTSIGSIGFVNSGIIDAQTGTIDFGGGNATFDAGSQFIGTGSTVVSNNAKFNGAFTSSNLSLTGGTFTGDAAQINGNVNFTGGVFNGSWEVASGQSLSGNSGGNKFMSGAAFTNNGTFQWQSGPSLFMQNGSSFTNNALHDIQATSSIVNNGGALPTYTNSSSGTLRVAAGRTATIGSIAFVNDGGTLQADGTLSFAGGNATFEDGTQFTGSGTNRVSGNANFNGAIESGNLVLQAGTYSGGAAVLSGSADFTGGDFTGSWELATGQVLNGLDGGTKLMSGAAFTNKGVVQWQSGNSLILRNGASFDNQGRFDMLTGMALNGGGAFMNSGTLHVVSGQSGSVGAIAFVNNGGRLDAQGTLNFDGGNATFDAGSRFTGSGVVALNSNAVFNGSFDSANLSLRQGTFTGVDAVINGIVELAGADLRGSWEVADGQTLVGRGAHLLGGTTLVNRGVIAWQTGNNLVLDNGASLRNSGLFDMQTGAELGGGVGGIGAVSTFDNSGTLRVAAGQNSSVSSPIAFINNAGTIDVGAGGSMTFNSSRNATFNPGTIFSGAGANLVTSNARFNGEFDSSNLVLRSGTMTGNGATLNGSGDFGGGLLQGSWTVAGGATLNGVDGGNKFISGGTLTNQGTLAWKTANSLFFQNGVDLLNQGTIDLQTDSAMIFNGGAVPTFINTGLIAKSGGSGTSTIGNNLGFDNQGVVDVRTGTIRLPDNFTNNGTLQGTGAFATNVLTNAGHIAPGGSPGTLTLVGNYVQASDGALDIELDSSSAFDLFAILGTASLTGTLDLHCVLGCALAPGDEFVILDSSGDLSGTFSNVALTGFGVGFQYDLVYDYTADLVKLGVLQVPEPGTGVLVISGLAALGMFAWRRRC